MKFINVLIVLSLVFIARVAYTQTGLEALEQERAALLLAYDANPKKGIQKKIAQKEAEMIAFIKENGFEVRIKTFFAYSKIEVKDKLYLGETIAVLKDKDTIILLEYLETGHFKVRTKDNKIGYLFHSDFSPSLEEYPMRILVPKTTSHKKSTEKTTPPKTSTTIYTPRSNSTSSKGCSTVQCSGTTQKGSRCRNRTTNCGGRCHLH